MLEQKIADLTDSICMLIERLDRIWQQTEEVAPKAQVPEKAAEPDAPAPEGPSTEELEDLCLSIVRDKPGLTPKIKSVIKNFGGELIKDCPKHKLPALKEEIMELAA